MDKAELRKEVLQRLYDKGHKYIARDKNNEVYIYKVPPEKKGSYWSNRYEAVKLLYFSDLFEDVTFEDEQPLDIAEEIGAVDWSQVPKDTKVLVSQDNEHWNQAHFAEFVSENEIYKFAVYDSGKTSWTIQSEGGGHKSVYRCCKLAEEI